MSVLPQTPVCPQPQLQPEVISWPSGGAHAWPTLIRRKDGSLMLVYSGGRDGHICPFGRVEMMISHDEGENWTWPRVVMDSDLDDRDSGVLETLKGTLLVTTFSHTQYHYILELMQAGERVPFIAEGQVRNDLLIPERIPAWQSAHRRIPGDALRKSRCGEWMLRSTDGGLTWSAPYRCGVSSPHGPIQLSCGRLFYAGTVMRDPQPGVAAFISDDDGITWSRYSDIPTRPGDLPGSYCEPHAVETAPGHIILHLRNHNEAHSRETLQCESYDGGKTWSLPRSIGIWGLPSHLLKLRDDTLLMTYSHRRPPYGNRAAFSKNQGGTWSAPIELSPDSDTADLGYPSTAQLADGSLLTVWYESLGGSARTVLRQVRWHLPLENLQ